MQEVSWGAGTPSWSLRFPQSRQEGEEGEEGLAGRRRVSWSERQRGRVGVPGTRQHPVSREPGLCLWVTHKRLLRSQGELGGLSWGSWWGHVALRAPQGQGPGAKAGLRSRDAVTRSRGAGLLLRPGVPTGVGLE